MPEAIAELKRANVGVWMLTGDKQATAVQVARCCRLISPPSANAFIIDVVGNNDDEVGRRHTVTGRCTVTPRWITVTQLQAVTCVARPTLAPSLLSRAPRP